jgi:hypothetical protein
VSEKIAEGSYVKVEDEKYLGISGREDGGGGAALDPEGVAEEGVIGVLTRSLQATNKRVQALYSISLCEKCITRSPLKPVPATYAAH